MADNKCGSINYCNATVADYNYAVNVLKCPCLKCFGANAKTCAICKKSAEFHADFQKLMCDKCQFGNRR